MTANLNTIAAHEYAVRPADERYSTPMLQTIRRAQAFALPLAQSMAADSQIVRSYGDSSRRRDAVLDSNAPAARRNDCQGGG